MRMLGHIRSHISRETYVWVVLWMWLLSTLRGVIQNSFSNSLKLETTRYSVALMGNHEGRCLCNMYEMSCCRGNGVGRLGTNKMTNKLLFFNKHQHDRHKIQTFGYNFYCRNQPLAGWNQNVTGSLWDSSYGKPLSHLLKLGWCGTQQSYEVRGNENDMMWHANSFEIRYSDSSILMCMYIYICVCVYVQHIIVNYPIRGTRLEGSELREHFVVGWGVSFFTFLHIINCNTKGSKLLVNSINTKYHEVSCVNAICRKFPLSFYHFSGFCRKQDPAVFDIGKGEVIKGSPVGWKTTDMWKGLWLCVSSFIHL